MTEGEKSRIADQIRTEAIESVEFLTVVERLQDMDLDLDLPDEEFDKLAREIHDEVVSG